MLTAALIAVFLCMCGTDASTFGTENIIVLALLINTDIQIFKLLKG